MAGSFDPGPALQPFQSTFNGRSGIAMDAVTTIGIGRAQAVNARFCLRSILWRSAGLKPDRRACQRLAKLKNLTRQHLILRTIRN